MKAVVFILLLIEKKRDVNYNSINKNTGGGRGQRKNKKKQS